jgi:hypothetical protein
LKLLKKEIPLNDNKISAPPSSGMIIPENDFINKNMIIDIVAISAQSGHDNGTTSQQVPTGSPELNQRAALESNTITEPSDPAPAAQQLSHQLQLPFSRLKTVKSIDSFKQYTSKSSKESTQFRQRDYSNVDTLKEDAATSPCRPLRGSCRLGVRVKADGVHVYCTDVDRRLCRSASHRR